MAGPFYQGTLELLDQELDREGMEAATASLVRPAMPHPAWWLLPPVMYFMRKRRNDSFREEAMTHLSELQLAQYTGLRQKASGWLVVSAGALLLSAGATWDLTEHYNWQAWSFWLIMLVLLAACISNTVLGRRRARRRQRRLRALRHR